MKLHSGGFLQKKNCEKCNKQISLPNYKRHLNFCINNNKSSVEIYKVEKGYKCPYCNKFFKKFGIKNHIWRIHTEEGKNYCRNYNNNRNFKPWNKGLTKETDARVKKNGESVSRTVQYKIKNGTYVPPPSMSIKNRKKLSEQQSLKNRGGKSKWFKIGNQKVQGTYELFFAQKLEEQCVKWERIKTNNHIFKYILDNKIKSYTPDFYLPDLNLYIEIKGYWWGNDKNKMLALKEQHKDKNVIILFGLQKIKDICIDIKTNLLKELIWSW